MARGVRTPDITGKRFGRLVALSMTRVGTYLAYVCRCDCGAECIKKATDLWHGRAKQCIPWDHEMPGRRFGRLEVLSYAGSDNSDGALFRCRCDCGRECLVPGHSLKRGNTRSCGCGNDENRAAAGERMSPIVHEGGTNLIVIAHQQPGDNNSSGIKGVHWDNRRQRWVARLAARGKNHFLGYYDDFADAAEARREAEELIHDPILSELGRDKTDEDEYQRILSEALDKLRHK